MSSVDVLIEDVVVEIKSVLDGDAPMVPGKAFQLRDVLDVLERYLEAQK